MRSPAEVIHNGRTLAEILADHALWLRGEGGERAILRGADLCDVDLRYANLRDVDLCGADLTGADLTGAALRGADMRGANLSGANMSNTDLSGADLFGAILTNVTGYIVGPHRSDGHRIDARLTSDGWRVVAGCLTECNLTLDGYEARARSDDHGYGQGAKRAETLAIIAYLRTRIALQDATQEATHADA